MAIHISAHFSAVNSVGLERIGYSAATPDPPGGVIRRREDGEPNGVLEELASIPPMIGVISPKDPADVAYFAAKGVEMAKSFGYTTAHEGRAMKVTHEAMVATAAAGTYDIDVVSYIDYTAKDILDGPWHSREYQDHYRVAGLKITLDGSPQGRTAWRTTPYLIPPDGQEPGYCGYPVMPDTAVVAALFEEAYAKGWQVLTHANADASAGQLIAAIRPSHEKYGPGDRRHVLVHGQLIRIDQLDDCAELGIIPSLFPLHTFYWGDWYDQIIGEEAAQRISPTRSALDRVPVITSHTDAPVALPNLMQVMWSTVNRVSRSGKVKGPDERLTALEALKCITIWGAYQHFEEDRKGSLKEGKLADLVILSDNPLTIDPMLLNTITVQETIKEGVTVWRR
jgi:predicted amidohydrolase YtcJ